MGRNKGEWGGKVRVVNEERGTLVGMGAGERWGGAEVGEGRGGEGSQEGGGGGVGTVQIRYWRD